MIRVDQPKPWDLVGDDLLIAGIGVGFEATINWRVGEGHDEISGYTMVGGGGGEHAQFQEQVDLRDRAFMLDRLFVDVYEASAKDGSDIHKTTVPVLYGGRIVDGYYGFRIHIVAKGETLSSIARQHYGTSQYGAILRANVHPAGITDVDELVVGKRLRIPVGS